MQTNVRNPCFDVMKARYWAHTYTFKRPAGTSRGILTQKPGYFLEVSVLDATGQGECGLLPGLSLDDRPGYEDALLRLCADLSALESEEWKAWCLTGIPRAVAQAWKQWPSIFFALEQACLSWKDAFHGGTGKILFPSAFAYGEAPIAINGLLWMGDPCFLSDQMEARLTEGFQCLKMKIGALDGSAEKAVLTDIRRLSPPSLELRVDANGAFDIAGALSAMESLAPLSLHSVEQPCSPLDNAGLQKVCLEGAVPTALDESLIGLTESDDRDRLLDTLRPAYIVLKPSLLGGFSSCEDWIQRAELRGIGWWITSALEGSVGLSAIAQWTAVLPHLMGYQGLGTGSLYSNNLPPRTYVKEGALWTHEA